MANKITYSINCTPIEELTTENNTKVATIASEIGKSLGCSGQASVVNYGESANNQGYLNQEVNYFEAPDNVTAVFSQYATATFVFVKNTGHKFESENELGVPLERSLKVEINEWPVATLNKGEGLILKCDNASINTNAIKVRTVDTDGTATVSGQKLAVEYLVLD